jgi:2-dehydropantoate 2-reductase
MRDTSSELDDARLRAGKVTGIRDFNGWIVETAELLGNHIDVPSHRILTQLVEIRIKLEKSSLADHFNNSRKS